MEGLKVMILQLEFRRFSASATSMVAGVVSGARVGRGPGPEEEKEKEDWPRDHRDFRNLGDLFRTG